MLTSTLSKIVIKLFFSSNFTHLNNIVLVNFFDLIVVIVDGLVIKCHYKNHTETDIVYCHPVKRSFDQLTEPWTTLTIRSTMYKPPMQPNIDESTIEGTTPNSAEQADQA